MILTYGGTSIDIGRAQYPVTLNTELIQVKERSASGVPHTEDYSVDLGTATYNFKNMSKACYLLLVDFYLNTVRGMSTEFTLLDDKGTTHIVNFNSATLNFKETSFELWSGNFSVEKAQ